MTSCKGMRRAAASACLLLLASTLLAPGAQDAPADGKTVDQQLFTVLRDVINRGREHYNNGDPAACYHMFQGALQVSRAALSHRPDVQKSITEGLAEAEAQPDMRRRAWVLRNVLDRVRGGLQTETAKAEKIEKPAENIEKPVEKVAEPKLPEKVEKPAEPTLWDRLGGKAVAEKVVDDFVAQAADDAKINLSRDGKVKLEEEQVVTLKKQLVAFLSQATGGPLKYTGPNIKATFKELAFTDEEFDAAAAVLSMVLEKNGAKEDDIKAALTAVSAVRKDIVMKKEEEKKDAEKKDEKKE